MIDELLKYLLGIEDVDWIERVLDGASTGLSVSVVGEVSRANGDQKEKI